MKLHIVAPDIRAGDAVGNHCMYLARSLRQHGFDTCLYARRHDADNSSPVLPMEQLFANGSVIATDDILLLSYSTFQPRLGELMAMPCRKVVYFHGVTPSDLLLDHDPAAAYWSARAMLQLPLLQACDHFIANSHWNLQDLLSRLPSPVPKERLSVLPPVTPDMPLFGKTPKADRPLHTPLRLITVGRLAPHKNVDDVIRMMAGIMQRGVDAELTVVGSSTSPDYARHLQSVANEAGVSASVTFTGHISDAALSACYAEADVLVTASLHEGFCIPVLEAMHLGIPVAVRNGTAASEVAAGVGLAYDTPEQGAAAIACLTKDQAAVRRMAAAGRSRAQTLLDEADNGRLAAILRRL